MQGNCGDVAPSFTPPTGHAPLRDLLPGQCLLLADHDLMWVGGQLWLDNLYVRLTSPREDEFGYFLGFADASSEGWLTGGDAAGQRRRRAGLQ